MQLVEQTPAHFAEHECISIGFRVASRLSLEALERGEFLEVPVEPYWKDYDAIVSERMTSLARRYDTRNWALLAAFDDSIRIGGIVMARATNALDFLEGRGDLAGLMDLRVDPARRGLGAGRALVGAALDWCRRTGCSEIKVETQDTNVAACRFYGSMGFVLTSIESRGYGPGVDDAKLIWRRGLDGPTSLAPPRD